MMQKKTKRAISEYQKVKPFPSKSNRRKKITVRLADRLKTQSLKNSSIIKPFPAERVEEALINTSQQWRAIFDGLSDIVCLLDPEGKIIKCNKAMTDLLGKPFGEIINHTHFEILHGAPMPIEECPVERLWKTHRRETGVLLINDRWFSIAVNPLLDEAGRFVGAVHIMSDVTEAKRAEEAIRESEKRYKQVVENAVDIIYTTDANGNFTYANPAALATTGYSLEELQRFNYLDLILPEHRDRVSKILINQFRKRQATTYIEFPFFNKSGDVLWFGQNASLVIEREKRVGFHVIARDITERKRMEDELRKSEETAKRLAQENAIMAEIGRIVSSTLNIEEVCERFAEEMRKLIQFERITINCINPKENTFVVLYSVGPYVADREIGKPVPISGTATEWVMQNRSSLLIQEVNREEMLGRIPCLLPIFKAGFRSMILIPLISKDQVIGTLALQTSKKNAYTGADLSLGERVGNQIAGAIASAQLFVEHKQAEEALREREEQYRTLLETMEEGYYQVDLAGNFTFLNESCSKMHGFPKEKMIGMNNRAYMSEETARKVYKIFNGVYKSGQPEKLVEWEIIRGDGKKAVMEASVYLIKNAQGEPIGFIGIERDITERKRIEEALRQSEEKYRNILENIEDGYYEEDLAGNFTFFNEAMCQIYGYPKEELFGLNYKKYTSEETAKKLFQIFNQMYRTGNPCKEYSYEIIRKDGVKRYIEATASLKRDPSGKPIGFRGVVRDITARKQAEEEKLSLQEQLRQSQKMEAIGQLAGGVAHDFNNLLTVIKGYSQLSLLDLKESDPLRGNIQEIEKATQRATDLTRQLLAFSRRQILDPKIVDLNALIIDLDKMLRRIIGEDIELVIHLSEDLGKVKVDLSQFEQVIFNLAVNARDAMPTGGKLTIETANVELDEAYAHAHVGVVPGPYVRLTVSDTGVGMTQEVKEKIFEPFFTTKEKGKGTGLGLSMVYGIVKQSNGNIWVYSEPNRGTTFRIYFPRTEEEADTLREREETDYFPRGSETVLLVEDDELVRDLANRLLKQQGYTVLEAANGQEALRVAKERVGETIHLLLADIVMPQMGGKELADWIKISRPNIKVLFTSGYADNAIVHHGVLDRGTHFLQKPFSLKTLSYKVREVLDG